MALDAARLSAAMRAAIVANVAGATDNQAMTDLCDAIATEVVAEIKNATGIDPAGITFPLASTRTISVAANPSGSGYTLSVQGGPGAVGEDDGRLLLKNGSGDTVIAIDSSGVGGARVLGFYGVNGTTRQQIARSTLVAGTALAALCEALNHTGLIELTGSY